MSSFPPTPPPPAASERVVVVPVREHPGVGAVQCLCVRRKPAERGEVPRGLRPAGGGSGVVVPGEAAHVLDLVLALQHLPALRVDEGRVHLVRVGVGGYVPGEPHSAAGVEEDEARAVAAGEARDAGRPTRGAASVLRRDGRRMAGGAERRRDGLRRADRNVAGRDARSGTGEPEHVEDSPVARDARAQVVVERRDPSGLLRPEQVADAEGVGLVPDEPQAGEIVRVELEDAPLART